MRISNIFGQKQARYARAAPASAPLPLPALRPSSSRAPPASYPIPYPILGQKHSQKLGFS